MSYEPTPEQIAAAKRVRQAIVDAKKAALAGKYGPLDDDARRAAEQFIRDHEHAEGSR